jgi:integrase
MRTLMERYLAEVTPTKKGHYSESYHMRSLLRSKLAEMPAGTLSPAAVRVWRDTRLLEVSGATVNRQMNLLHHLIEHARKEWGIGYTNPVSDVARPKSGKGRNRRLLSGEEDLLLSACAESRRDYLREVVVMALETAMRQSELIGLRWELIDLAKQTAHLVDTKNGDSRTVPLSTTAVALLKHRRPPGRATGQVWTGITTEAVKQSFQRACERADIQGLRFHDLRHEAISRLFERGLHAVEVAAISGHKDLRMLMRYTHLDASKLAAKLS